MTQSRAVMSRPALEREDKEMENEMIAKAKEKVSTSYAWEMEAKTSDNAMLFALQAIAWALIAIADNLDHKAHP